MYDSSFHQRVGDLYGMLAELAAGNTSLRIGSDWNGDVGRLANKLNLFADDMESVLRKSGSMRPFSHYQAIAHSALLLDLDFTIIGLSGDIASDLCRIPEELLHLPIEHFLSEESKHVWRRVASRIETSTESSLIEQLTFATPTNEMFSSRCTISRVFGSENYLVSFVRTELPRYAQSDWRVLEKPSDARIAEDLHAYIMSHLEAPLPTIKQLAQSFGTNEFKLKQCFRQFFESGIHQFYNAERLKHAHLRIQHSAEPLKFIAFAIGFQEYAAFSKAFKKQFGYGPAQVIRNLAK